MKTADTRHCFKLNPICNLPPLLPPSICCAPSTPLPPVSPKSHKFVSPTFSRATCTLSIPLNLSASLAAKELEKARPGRRLREPIRQSAPKHPIMRPQTLSGPESAATFAVYLARWFDPTARQVFCQSRLVAFLTGACTHRVVGINLYGVHATSFPLVSLHPSIVLSPTDQVPGTVVYFMGGQPNCRGGWGEAGGGGGEGLRPLPPPPLLTLTALSPSCVSCCFWFVFAI